MHTILVAVVAPLYLAGPDDAPLYQRIQVGVREAIEAGRLGPGDRLPSVAEVAFTLKVARLTVLKAFQGLERDGVLSSEVGRGTFVAGGDRAGAPGAATPPPADGPDGRSLRTLREGYARGVQDVMRVPRPPGTLDLTGGVPSPDTVPEDILARLTRDVLATDPRRLYAYPGPAGLASLREAVAHRLALDGLAVSPNAVVATNGTQQAISLVAAWARENARTVLCETPTYSGVPGAFLLLGHAVTSVPLVEEGPAAAALDLDVLRARGGPRPLLYVCPDFQNPTGRTLSSRARDDIAAWARATDAVVVEDLIFRDLRFAGDAPAPLYGRLPPGRRILVGSVSKSFMTGLRVGYLAADPALVEELLPYKRSMDLGGPTLVQAVAAAFLADGYDAHVARMRPWYLARRDAAVAALADAMPAGTRVSVPEGGFQLWVTLPDGLSALEVFLRGVERGVAIAPGPAYDVDGGCASSFRLGYTTATPEDVREGVRRLGAAIASLTGREARAAAAASTPV